MAIAGWSALGVGAASLVVSVVLGAMAKGKAGEYEDAHNKDHMLYAEAKDILNSAEGLEKGCFVMLGVGVAAAATGAVLLLLPKKKSGDTDQAKRLQLVPQLAGAGLVYHF